MIRAQLLPHEVATNELAGVAARIVEIEGPIHGLEVARRIATVWGLHRAGNRIQEATNRALRWAVRRGTLVRDGDFCWATKEGDKACYPWTWSPPPLSLAPRCLALRRC